MQIANSPLYTSTTYRLSLFSLFILKENFDWLNGIDFTSTSSETSMKMDAMKNPMTPSSTMVNIVIKILFPGSIFMFALLNN